MTESTSRASQRPRIATTGFALAPDAYVLGVWGTLHRNDPSHASPSYGYLTLRQWGGVLFVQVESPAVDILPEAVLLVPLQAVNHIEVQDRDEVHALLAAEANTPHVRKNIEIERQRLALGTKRLENLVGAGE